jgi:hypothetical protein
MNCSAMKWARKWANVLAHFTPKARKRPSHKGLMWTNEVGHALAHPSRTTDRMTGWRPPLQRRAPPQVITRKNDVGQVGQILSVYWVYSGFDRSPDIQKDGAAIYGECNCSVAQSGPRDGGRWRNVP